jgi:tRNA threonylcarbamoyladenosine biosynthesis protein TsaE
LTEKIITHSSEETITWGREFAKRLKAPVLILLTGDLGTGKTTFTKGIVSGLGAAHENDVTSPTFTLVHVYGKQTRVYHADLYRIESFHDFETLGLEDMFATPAVAILEWSEKFPLQSPWPQIRVRLEHLGGDARRITVLDPSALS